MLATHVRNTQFLNRVVQFYFTAKARILKSIEILGRSLRFRGKCSISAFGYFVWFMRSFSAFCYFNFMVELSVHYKQVMEVVIQS